VDREEPAVSGAAGDRGGATVSRKKAAAIAAVWSSRAPEERAAIPSSAGESVVTLILREFGGLEPKDWRGSNRKPGYSARIRRTWKRRAVSR